MRFLSPKRINTALKAALAQQARIAGLVRSIRAVDPYYADKSDSRIIEDALKAWHHTVATQAAMPNGGLVDPAEFYARERLRTVNRGEVKPGQEAYLDNPTGGATRIRVEEDQR